ncbi:MAG: maleylpyruvate isomerase N-terminal domain-containing protein [Acidimicrobiales bacterium]
MGYQWIIDGLDETWSSVASLLASRPEEDFDRPTPCPGWSVRDILSHLTGFEEFLNGAPVPTFEGPFPDYVRNDVGRFNEAFVQAARSVRGDALLDRFRQAAAQSLDRLRALSDADWDRVGWSPDGERPYHRFQETRILDGWIHLQDLRDALLEPDDDHGIGEEVVVNRFEAALPYIVGRKMGVGEEFTLQVNLVGRLGRTALVRVHDGRGEAVPSLSAPPDLEVTTPVALFWRRAAGRISAEAWLATSATDVRGDPAVARAFADALCVMI